MKICYVTHQPNLTGANQSLLDMISLWNKDEVEPLVLLRKKGPIIDELKKRNIKYKVVFYTTANKSNKHQWKDIFRIIANCFAVIKIKKILKSEKVDIVHNNSIFVGVGMEAAYQLKIPYISHLREFGWDDQMVTLLNEKRQYYLVDNASCAIAISKAIKEKYEKEIRNVKYVILYNGIDEKKYYQKHSQLFSENVTKILLAGRISPGKCQIDAIKAAEILINKNICNFILYIVGGVGDFEYNKKIKEYVIERDIQQIKFVDFCDLKDMRANCDICLICSKKEAMGRVTIEGMMSGCLTIGANSGATPELISDGVNGILYESENPISLSNAIIKAMNEKTKMREIAKNGQTYAVETFSVNKYNEKIKKIYNKIRNGE